MNSTIFDLLDLVFFRSFYQIRGRFCKIRSMCFCFLIWHEKSEVKYVMDFPTGRKGQSVCHWSEDFLYRKRAISLGCQTQFGIHESKVLPV